jgi:L-alanine-DL-glutamate epimerase-like enolase superfamily enzyme
VKLEVEPIRLSSKHPFQIARGTRDTFELFVVSLTHEGVVGIGEASPQAFYGESPLTVRSAVNSIGRLLEGEPDELRRRLHTPEEPLGAALTPHASVRAALDMALWDIRGKMEGVPCCRLFGADPANTPLTSFTIGFGPPEVIDRKVDAAAPFHILKVKVGLPGDMAILDRVIKRGVEFIEQPIRHEDEEGLRTLKRLSPLPVILDESIRGVADVHRCRDQGHGINIKLMKCGGITPALDLIAAAREHELSIMLGCMLETSVGVTAAAHLSPLVDYADLDGNLLLDGDPFEGVEVVGGKLVLPERPGLGVIRRA